MWALLVSFPKGNTPYIIHTKNIFCHSATKTTTFDTCIYVQKLQLFAHGITSLF